MWKIDKVRGPWETESRTRWGSKTRSITIEVEPLCIVYRPKGTRQRFRLTHEKVMQLAVQAHVEATRKTRRRVTRGRVGG